MLRISSCMVRRVGASREGGLRCVEPYGNHLLEVFDPLIIPGGASLPTPGEWRCRNRVCSPCDPCDRLPASARTARVRTGERPPICAPARGLGAAHTLPGA